MNIDNLINQIMAGGNMSSLLLAGRETVIYFDSSDMKGCRRFYIDTDSDVGVYKINSNINSNEEDESDYLFDREDAIVKLYNLTGFDIDSVSLINNVDLKININDFVILIKPQCQEVNNNTYCDSWSLITEKDSGSKNWVAQVSGDEVLINEDI